MKKLRCILLLLIGWYCLSGCSETVTTEYKEPQRITYEVIAVTPYVATETNHYGKVCCQYIAYSFYYLDHNGNMHYVAEHYQMDYGIKKVKLGETNQYVLYKGYEVLYLTKEALGTAPINS